MAAVVGASALGALLIMGLIYWGDSPSGTESLPLTTLPGAAIASSIAADVSAVKSIDQPPSAAPSVSTDIVSEVVASSTAAVDVATTNAPVQESQVVTQSVVPLVQTNSLPRSAAAQSVGSRDTDFAETKKAEVEPKSTTIKNPEVVATEKVSSVPVATSNTDQEKILLSWGESEFTLQLMGLSSEAAMTKFVAQQPNRKDLLVFKSLRKGKDWFVAVTGRYPSAAKAQQAIKLLPDEQKKAQPWSRDLKTIQREIKSK